MVISDEIWRSAPLRGTHTCKNPHIYIELSPRILFFIYLACSLNLSHAHFLTRTQPEPPSTSPCWPNSSSYWSSRHHPEPLFGYCQEGAASQYPYPSLNVSTYGLMAVLDHCTGRTTIVKSRLLFPSTVKWIALIIVLPSPKAMTSLQHYWTVAVSSQSTLMLILKLCIRIHHEFLADSATHLHMSFTPDALLDTTPTGICVPGWNWIELSAFRSSIKCVYFVC